MQYEIKFDDPTYVEVYHNGEIIGCTERRRGLFFICPYAVSPQVEKELNTSGVWSDMWAAVERLIAFNNAFNAQRASERKHALSGEG